MNCSYNDLKKEYDKAVKNKQETFVFLGEYELVVDYAKYLLQYMETQCQAYKIGKNEKVFDFHRKL
jgi:hypothetical protein